jgi:hypothetical protein
MAVEQLVLVLVLVKQNLSKKKVLVKHWGMAKQFTKARTIRRSRAMRGY